MNEEFDYLKKVDEILPRFLHDGGYTANGETMHFDLTPTGMAIDQLLADKYLVEDPRYKQNYRLTSEGRAFIMRGGYKAKFEEEERLQRLSESQTQSVIDTNLAIRKFNKRALWLSGASVLFIIATVILQYADKTSEEVRGIKEQLKQQSNALQQLRFSLEKVSQTISDHNNDTAIVKVLQHKP